MHNQVAGSTYDLLYNEINSSPVNELQFGGILPASHVVTAITLDNGNSNMPNSASASVFSFPQVGDTLVPYGDGNLNQVIACVAPSSPSLALTKTITSTPVNGVASIVGETITYSLLVSNLGNVAIDGLTLTDPAAGPISCPSDLASLTLFPIGTLHPSRPSSITCTASHLVTLADLVAGSTYPNTATADAAQTPSVSSSATAPIAMPPTTTTTTTSATTTTVAPTTTLPATTTTAPPAATTTTLAPETTTTTAPLGVVVVTTSPPTTAPTPAPAAPVSTTAPTTTQAPTSTIVNVAGTTVTTAAPIVNVAGETITRSETPAFTGSSAMLLAKIALVLSVAGLVLLRLTQRPNDV